VTPPKENDVKIQYTRWAPQAATMAIVRRADDLAADYAAQGYDLTLRQLYYQFVQRGWLANTQNNYKRLGEIVNSARLAGLIDWDHITDRTRNLRSRSRWNSPAEIVQAVADQYHVDLWEDQDLRVEVWVEKEALAGVVARAAEPWDCPWFSCRGYVSQSEMWGAARRFMGHIEAGQRVVVIHLGDHDPSGIDMTRDIQDRLTKFAYTDLHASMGVELDDDPDESVDWDDAAFQVGEWFLTGNPEVMQGAAPIEITRIALNMDQIREYQPPPNPAKLTDSRIESYIAAYGRQSWELDALDPATLDALISDTIAGLVDDDKFEARKDIRSIARAQLQGVSDRWDDVVDLVES
jgi:hypothetical protein